MVYCVDTAMPNSLSNCLHFTENPPETSVFLCVSKGIYPLSRLRYTATVYCRLLNMNLVSGDFFYINVREYRREIY